MLDNVAIPILRNTFACLYRVYYSGIIVDLFTPVSPLVRTMFAFSSTSYGVTPNKTRRSPGADPSEGWGKGGKEMHYGIALTDRFLGVKKWDVGKPVP